MCYLRNFVVDQNLDFFVGSEVGVILQRGPDRVRAPDASVIARDRLPGGRVPKSFLDVVPDLIVEVVSPNDRASEVQAKVQEWLEAGARLVWVCDPRTRTVMAYRGLSEVRIYREADELDAEPVLPGFAVTVARLFA